MKIETLRRGLNKDECFCGSEKDIKIMLETLSLDDTYNGVVNMGKIISRDKNGMNYIFEFSYSSRPHQDISDYSYRKNIWFDFYPIKKKNITEELKEEFKSEVIPLLKSEILSCIKRNHIVEFVSVIKVSIKNGKLAIIKESR